MMMDLPSLFVIVSGAEFLNWQGITVVFSSKEEATSFLKNVRMPPGDRRIVEYVPRVLQ